MEGWRSRAVLPSARWCSRDVLSFSRVMKEQSRSVSRLSDTASCWRIMTCEHSFGDLMTPFCLKVHVSFIPLVARDLEPVRWIGPLVPTNLVRTSFSLPPSSLLVSQPCTQCRKLHAVTRLSVLMRVMLKVVRRLACCYHKPGKLEDHHLRIYMFLF